MSGHPADKPAFANDTDTPETPSIETSPGVLPQKPIAGEAPSREQAGGAKPKAAPAKPEKPGAR
ncbi:hypothetical protein N825_25930 [Skermanella stibiiresistens SB22]|uniref:Uncharacterized protein n=1 Tax=Skermanella stibiiresistens SB22 TaxID=1385369 RepID=W9GYW9_9PROT|nr:hypothetical protein [Skermanella stibiiresistens]EWY36663.1 hypothetical protein N825_25930 [Skermanella stibiiresistens SB22]